jgi:hypothetical protein
MRKLAAIAAIVLTMFGSSAAFAHSAGMQPHWQSGYSAAR